ncbi:MAG: hypothetical protein HC811_10715 [Flammeovirgaceae bacterium]|nr:hypothetical protein [Flammeovirgaceae bacterium]
MFIAVILISATASVFLFKDRIVQQFIREANKSLNTPVKIADIDISLLNDFPNLAIICRDVYIEDSHPGQYPLFTATTLYFFLNPIEVWQGKYSIRGLRINDSETNLKVNEAGQANYDILKKIESTESSSIGFDLRNVRLRNTIVRYNDIKSNLDHAFSSSDLSGTIIMKDHLYDITAKGDLTIDQLGVDQQKYLVNKFLMPMHH